MDKSMAFGFFVKYVWIKDFQAQLRSAFRPLQFRLIVALASEKFLFSPFTDINLNTVQTDIHIKHREQRSAFFSALVVTCSFQNAAASCFPHAGYREEEFLPNRLLQDFLCNHSCNSPATPSWCVANSGSLLGPSPSHSVRVDEPCTAWWKAKPWEAATATRLLWRMGTWSQTATRPSSRH